MRFERGIIRDAFWHKWRNPRQSADKILTLLTGKAFPHKYADVISTPQFDALCWLDKIKALIIIQKMKGINKKEALPFFRFTDTQQFYYKKMAGILLVTFLIPLLATGVIAFLCIGIAESVHERKEGFTTLEAASREMEQIFQYAEDFSGILITKGLMGKFAGFRETSRDYISLAEFSDDYIRNVPLIKTILLIRDGYIVFERGPALDSEIPAFPDDLEKAEAESKKKYWAPPRSMNYFFADEYAGRDVIPFYKKISYSTSPSVVFVFIGIDEKELIKRYMSYNKGVFFFVRQEDFTVVSSTEKEFQGKAYPAELRGRIKGEKGHFRVNHRGTAVYTNVFNEWYLVNHLPPKRLGINIAGYGIIIPVAVFLAICFTFRRIHGVIHELYTAKIYNQEAAFKTLTSQINPHFLYNTLDSIRWKAIQNRDFAVSEQIETLADMFKSTLSKGNDMVTVEQELQQLERYLAIMRFRYGDRIKCTITVSEKAVSENTVSENASSENAAAEKVLSVKVPKLILQPLVENAILHGIEPQIRQGEIVVLVEMRENLLYIVVRDNGRGIDAKAINEKLHNGETNVPQYRVSKPWSWKKRRAFGGEAAGEAVRESGETTGFEPIQDDNAFALKNIDRRIKLRYGGAYGMTFDSAIGEGTVVTLVMPI
jgi:two-component system sensor histidine kinase YesM